MPWRAKVSSSRPALCRGEAGARGRQRRGPGLPVRAQKRFTDDRNAMQEGQELPACQQYWTPDLFRVIHRKRVPTTQPALHDQPYLKAPTQPKTGKADERRQPGTRAPPWCSRRWRWYKHAAQPHQHYVTAKEGRVKGRAGNGAKGKDDQLDDTRATAWVGKERPSAGAAPIRPR